jgi:cytoskeletal protein RodZ
MALRTPSDFDVIDPIVGDGLEPEQPIPGWRKPIALAGWGLLIAILIALIIWGIIQLARGAPPQEPATTITTTPTTSPPRPAPVISPSQQRTPELTTSTEIPTASTMDTDTPTTTATSSSSPRAFPVPQLPSVLTLPPLPGLPTEITLPPGL